MTQPTTSEARAALVEYADRYGYTDHVNALLDDYRAAVLREAADAIEQQQAKLDAEIQSEYGELDYDTEVEGAATRGMAALLRRMAEEARS